jgi:AcrR family transcriptional regulator
MGSLYRRFPTKTDMLAYLCQTSLQQQIDVAEAALAEPDSLAALTSYVTTCIELRVGVLSLLAGGIPVAAETRALGQRAHRLLELIVTRAQRAGVLRADISGVDIYRLIELFSRRQLSDPLATERLVTLSLDGMRAPGHSPLPGERPSWAEYARRWEPGLAAPDPQPDSPPDHASRSGPLRYT